MRVVAIDFETANRCSESVCALGIATLEDGIIIKNKYYSLICPSEDFCYFEPFNVKVHHITPDMVEDAPNWSQVYDDIYGILDGAIVCAHNAPFDMKCLADVCAYSALKLPKFQYFDTVQLSKKMLPNMPHHRLNDMCEVLQIELNHHHAGSDAYGCLMIVKKCMEMTGINDIEELLNHMHVRLHTK